MISLNILNIRKFLEVVNECEGEIKMRCTDGSKVNIRRQYAVQNKLQEQYRRNRNCLPITLSIPNPRDYMSIVAYYAGDC